MSGTATSPVGRLTVDLAVHAGVVLTRIRHKPGLAIASRLVGRPRAQAVAIVPAVLNLCATAHRQAAAAAVGLETGDGNRSRHETIRDHGLTILRDWPACLGVPAEPGALGELTVLGAGPGPADDQDGAMTALRRRLCGERADPTRFEMPDLRRWLSAGETPTARFLAAVRHRFDPVWGRVALPAPTLADITDAALPAREATCTDRVRGMPLLAEIETAEGRSLFARLLGRLLDLLRELDGRNGTTIRPPTGFGIAEASRGRLVHTARLDGDTITAYRIVTPTDWNLTDDGLLYRMLTSLPPDERLESAARLALACVDPCVPTTLRVCHA